MINHQFLLVNSSFFGIFWDPAESPCAAAPRRWHCAGAAGAARWRRSQRCGAMGCGAMWGDSEPKKREIYSGIPSGNLT